MKLISTDGPVDFDISIFKHPHGGVVFSCGERSNEESQRPRWFFLYKEVFLLTPFYCQMKIKSRMLIPYIAKF